jgi:anti-sigma regulatory factor (Ser/Thr protein kinase)
MLSRAGSRRLLTLLAVMMAGPGAPADAPPKRRTFAGCPRQARRARQFVAGKLNGSPCTDTAVLLTSELVTNALAHSLSGTEGLFEVIVWRDAAGVLVAVVDDGSDGNPAAADADLDSESGRGLGLVAALADRWGHAGGAAGRAVWFLLREHDE